MSRLLVCVVLAGSLLGAGVRAKSTNGKPPGSMTLKQAERWQEAVLTVRWRDRRRSLRQCTRS